MAENAIFRILTALLKHQVKKLLGEETLGVIGEELWGMGEDKLDALLSDKSTVEQLKRAALDAQNHFRDKVGDQELEQWMVMLPLGSLPTVVKAIEELPDSPDESRLEHALRASIALNWKTLSPEQVDGAVNTFLSSLRSVLLPLEKQTLMVIGRSALRTEEKVNDVKSTVHRSEEKIDLLIQLLERRFITGEPASIKSLAQEPVEYWYLKHPYPMLPNFTGRVTERKMLVDWLNDEEESRLLILRALGGFGKSALAWHWLTHDIDSNQWPKVLWWSFYEGDPSFEHFVKNTLKYLKIRAPRGQRTQVDELLKAMQSHKILVIMDGFERELRAYSGMSAAYHGDEQGKEEDSQRGCINMNAEFFLRGICSLPNIRSKVLMTTRLTPRTLRPHGELLQHSREEELATLQKEDAVEFFHRQKIKGTHAEIETACSLYGYHPLSLRLLAGRILKDFERPADISVAQKLRIDGDIKQHQHHVLEVSFNSLLPHEQKLLSFIACFRSPVELKTLQSTVQNKDTLDTDLHDLVARGLLHFDKKNKRFDLHPLVRRYVYERMTLDDRALAHTRLRDYFATVDVPEEVNAIDELTPVIEQYHHAVRAGDFEEAWHLFESRLHDHIYYQFGAYELQIELLSALFPQGEDKPPALKRETGQASAISNLAAAYYLSGQGNQAAPLFERHNQLQQEDNDKKNLAVGFGNLAFLQLAGGALLAATSSLQRRIELAQEAQQQHSEGVGHINLADIKIIQGNWDEAEKEIQTAVDCFRNTNAKHDWTAKCWLARSKMALFMSNVKDANLCAQKALEFSKKAANEQNFAVERDFVRAHWLIGVACRLDRQFKIAEDHLSEALTRVRATNLVELEANVLLGLAHLRYDQKNYDEAKSLSEEALFITERCGYVLQGADVNLFLAQYAQEQEKDKAKAKEYAETALKLAYCDGPPYYYKVAYEEAERMLEQLR